ncbi:MAG: shikimate kinase [Burkholderiaceae bacterium]
MNRSVFLIGMPGCGKSTLGKRLATRMGRTFIDADRELEERCGVTVATMFDIEGEQGFRDREHRLLAELSEQDGLIVATGGGVVLREDNRHLLKGKPLVLYLQASVAELWSRLRNDRKRPLLQGADPRGRLEALFKERGPLYESVADMTFRGQRQSPDRQMSDIIALLLDSGHIQS